MEGSAFLRFSHEEKMSRRAEFRGSRLGAAWLSIRRAIRPESVLDGRLPGEREMSVNRLVAGSAVLCYLLTLTQIVPLPGAPAAFAVALLYLSAGVAIFANVRLRPDRLYFSRWHAMLLDIGLLSVLIASGGGYTALFFFAYLWIIVGNGLRYGVRYLWASAALSVAGFGTVVLASPFWSALPFLTPGLVLGLVVVPIYLGALLHRLGKQTQQLDTSNRAKAAVLSSISEELRAPLAAVVALNRTLAGTDLDHEQRSVVRIVGEAARSVLAELDDLLELSRLEEQARVTLTTFDLVDLVQEVVGLTRVIAASKGIHVACFVSADTPCMVRTDKQHLRQALLSLAYNAVRFTRVGSVIVSVGRGSAAADGTLLRFEISDTGIGMAPEVQEGIFHSFSRADAGVLDAHRSSGLGLAVAQRLVGALGGNLGVESRVGEGSTFSFAVPAEEAASEAPQPGSLAGLAVLILSRAPLQLRSLVARLDGLGALTFLLDSTDQMEGCLTACAERIDRAAILVDSHDVDPSALAYAVHQHAAFSAVPLVLLSASSAPPPVSVRQLFVSAITASRSDVELHTAFRAAAPLPAQVALAPDPAIVSEPGQAEEAPGAAAAQPRVRQRLVALVADGNRTGQLLLARALEEQGHTVTVVGDGYQALDACAATDFDVAFLDIDLPEMDGPETTRMIRFSSQGRGHLPIIGIAADATPETARRCTAAGMDACLAKPVSRAALAQAIASLVAVNATPMAAPVARPAVPGVTDIATHPLFQAGLSPAVDAEVLAQIAGVGDAAHARTVAQAFGAVAAATCGFLRSAVAQGDPDLFHGQLSTLHAQAATVGARRVEALCAAGNRITRANLAREGGVLLDRLSREIVRAREELERLPDARQSFRNSTRQASMPSDQHAADGSGRALVPALEE